MGLGQGDQTVLLHPLLLLLIGLRQTFLVLNIVLHWFWFDNVCQLNGIGRIVHPWEASLLVTCLLLRCLRNMLLRFVREFLSCHLILSDMVCHYSGHVW